MPFHPFLGEGSPTKIDRKKGTLILTSLLKNLDSFSCSFPMFGGSLLVVSS